MESTPKYLGLIRDPHWRCGLHFAALAPKLFRTLAMLARLLPNFESPEKSVSRFYVEIVQSMLLYGAQVWCDAIRTKPRARGLIRGVIPHNSHPDGPRISHNLP